MTPTRLAIVVTHPIQHFVHLYRALACAPDIAVKVFFCARMGLDSYFDRQMQATIAWKTDLVGGYDHEFLPGAEAINAPSFFSVDNPGVGRRLAAFAPDAVVIYGYGTRTYLRALAWCRLHRVPALMISDANDVTVRRPARAAARRAVLAALLPQFAAFLTVGDQNEAALRALGVPLRKLFRSPFPIDETAYDAVYRDRAAVRARSRARYAIPPDAFTLVCVGKLLPAKRPGDIFDALDLLARHPVGVPLHLLVCGNGELFEPLRARAAATGAPVTLAGFVNVDELPACYAAADALVHPSESDQHPLVCCEAAALGMPMVLSDKVGTVGPTSIARRDVNALVYRCGDIGALAGAIRTLATSPEKVAAMGRASREIFEASRLGASVAGVRAALASCVGAPARAQP